MDLAVKSDESSDGDRRDDVEFDRELVESGYAMRRALQEERKRQTDDDTGLEERIDVALHDLMPEVLEAELGNKEVRVNIGAFAQSAAAKRRTAAASRRQKRKTSLDPTQPLPGAPEASEDDDKRLRRMKQLIWSERRMWGDPPTDTEEERSTRHKPRRPGRRLGKPTEHDAYMRDEIKHYQETISEKYDRLGPASRGQGFTKGGTDFTKAVKEGVMRYHQRCEAAGVYKTFTVAHDGSGLTAENREMLTEHIKCLRDDIQDDPHPKDARVTRIRAP